MKKKIFFGVIFIIIAAGAVLPQPGHAFYLFGDKLRVKGSIYENLIYGTNFDQSVKPDYRSTNWGLVRTKATLELLYKAVENPCDSLNFFGFFKYYYEATPDIDDKYRKSIYKPLLKNYKKCNYYPDEWINEMYADWYHGPWNIRAGKQIIFWSEVELIRTIDQVNQLDLRYTVPGIDPWDEMKIGLWMLRGFYNSQLPGQLVFEGMIIPDFRPIRTPMEGTFWGDPAGPPYKLQNKPHPPGLQGNVEEQWRKSKPPVNLRHTSFAARIRGNSEVKFFTNTVYLLDWTLSYLYAPNNTPIARKKYLGSPSALNIDTNTLNGFNTNLAYSRVFGLPLPTLPSHRFWDYRYMHMIGGSLQSYVPQLKGVVRGELMYEINHPEITADPGGTTPSYSKSITGNATRNIVNAGITYDVPIKADWLQNQQWLGANGIFDTSFGWFEQWRLGDVMNIRRTNGYQQKVQTGFTLTSRTSLRNNSITPVFRGLYNTRKWGYTIVALSYTPGAHWRYETGYLWSFAHNVWDDGSAHAKGKDNIYLKVGYEF
jgi:hypothetical protein